MTFLEHMFVPPQVLEEPEEFQSRYLAQSTSWEYHSRQEAFSVTLCLLGLCPHNYQFVGTLLPYARRVLRLRVGSPPKTPAPRFVGFKVPPLIGGSSRADWWMEKHSRISKPVSRNGTREIIRSQRSSVESPLWPIKRLRDSGVTFLLDTL